MPINRNFDWPAFRELTVGMGGVGKTTAFMERLKREKANYYFVFDHKHEFGRKLGKPYCYTVEQMARQIARGPGWIVFDPCEMAKEMVVDGKKKKPRGVPGCFDFFCRFVRDASMELKGRKLLVCDELDQHISKFQKPDDLVLCLNDGRCYCLDFMGIAQATNSIHNEVRGQMTDFYTFVQVDENAIADLRDRGFKDEHVRALKPGEFLYRNINFPETRKGGKAFSPKQPRGASFATTVVG